MRDRRERGERGAALTEFLVFVSPLLVMLVFGIIEFGSAWRDSLVVSTSSRAGARTVSNLGDDELSDYSAIASAVAGLDSIDPANVQSIVVFRSASPSGALPNALCATQSVPGQCNYYDYGTALAAVPADFQTATAATTCNGQPDQAWCPAGREKRLSVGPDYVGVRIEVHHDWVTGIFPHGGITITETTIMRIEPRIDT